MISHANVVRLFAQMQDRFHFQSGDVWTLFHSSAFDFSVWEMWGALLYGGRLVVVPYWLSRSPDEFYHYLVAEQVTVLNQTPSAFRQLIETEQTCAEGMDLEGMDLALRLVIFGGEALELSCLGPWFARHGDQNPQLVNMYGITETTVHVTCLPLTQATMQAHQGRSGSPIGAPLADLQCYVLDAYQRPVPLGVPGELYIGGMGLSRGYWQRADVTAERFIPHPFVGKGAAQDTTPASVQPGARLYRTGDLVRNLATGDLEYLGRIDNQVKLRGYRIELGEIEATLRSHMTVQENVVVVREERPDEKQLVAYVVPVAGKMTQTWPLDLRQHLQRHLPTYMIPAQFVVLSALPRNANGKVDRRALPEPGLIQESRREIAGVPSTPLQELLVAIWKEVLHLTQVGIHDNFFELGGHSLLATQAVSRIRRALAVDVPLRSLFEAPTVAQLSSHLEELIRGSSSTLVPDLLPMERGSALPLSFAQERLWFLYQWEPDSPWYNIARALSLSGPLHVSVLERSLARVVQRHEVLRTTFEERSGHPVQVIKPKLFIQIPVIDLCGLVTAEQDQQITALQHLEAQRPFDLSRGPLLRACLLRLDVACDRGTVGKEFTPFPPLQAPQEHVLLLTLHHIVTDAWSMRVLVHEMTTFYQADLEGEPSEQAQDTVPPLPDLPIQYADYTLWQREFLQGEVLDEQMAYWREQLADLSPLLLPTDHPRPRVKTGRGAIQSRLLPRALSNELLHICQKLDVTLFMLLLSTFQVLLMRYTGQTDISVGTPIANRTRAELEGLIGFFINTLVLRTDLGGNPTFDLLLQRVREVCLQAYMHQDVPFEKVVEELAPQRDLSLSPLFQVMLVLQNAPLGGGVAPTRDLVEVGGAGLEPRTTTGASPRATVPVITPLRVESVTSKFDLTLTLSETAPGGLACVLEYNTDLFEQAFITRLLAHFQTLLQGIVQDPQARLSDLPLLTEEEQEQLLVQWNATQADYPQDLCLHQLIEQQVKETPERIAVVFEEQQLTYHELNGLANQLAHRLMKEGIGPDRLVGVCIERSLELVIALLAVLKAGGAYVPLDPNYPQERLTFLLSDAQVPVVLTQTHLHDLMGNVWSGQASDHRLPFAITTICVDSFTSLLEERDTPPCPVQPENLAYMIYTSGSTGQPKGVQIPHQAIINFLAAMIRQLGLEVSDTLLAVTPVSFDIVGLELFLPLVAGARVVLASREVAREGERLGLALVEHGTTMMQATPSTWRLLLEADGLARSTLRVLCGGETLPPDLARQLLDLRGGVWNLYGPTETTIWSTLYPVVSGDGPLPIGRPIANTQIYLLDSNLQPVPIGVPGELYIGGEGLARGYWRRPDLTAERFIPNPFVGTGQEPGPVPRPPVREGTRLYRTGDLARYRPDGTLEYLGRMDSQVKLRGYRIEPGEIEARLLDHPAVQDCIVIAREDEPGEKRLVAYVIASSLSAVKPVSLPSILRNYLKEKLPRYMVPAALVLLERWPLTTNGKVDRSALPMPEFLSSEREETFVAPRTAVEKVLAGIWEDVLGGVAGGLAEPVGIHDDFFELGGHSLLATQVVARIHETLQVALPLREIFEAPTVAEIAVLLLRDPNQRVRLEKIAQIVLELSTFSDSELEAIINNLL
jgi:amino acid adenylation domain-containing protein